MGEALRRAPAARVRGRRATALVIAASAGTLVARAAGALLLLVVALAAASAQPTYDMRTVRVGRFTITAAAHDELLARSIAAAASRHDSFPGLPRPQQSVRIDIAPDRQAFQAWIGTGAPEWGAAFAFPAEQRIVMQGRDAASAAGDPLSVLRHELAHLALSEHLGDDATRWFHEGYASYAAGEWSRDQVVATNLALALRGMPSLAALDSAFSMGAQRADAAYALAYLAVAELASIDPKRGLTLVLQYWKESGEFEVAVRQAFGITTVAFEQRWRSHTRRRYGVIAFFADATLAAGVLLFVIGPFYVIRRRRDRVRMEALRRADAEAERRERESVLEALLQSGGDVPVERRSPADQPP